MNKYFYGISGKTPDLKAARFAAYTTTPAEALQEAQSAHPETTWYLIKCNELGYEKWLPLPEAGND